MQIPETAWLATEKIIVCSGEGIRACTELTDYHRYEYAYWNELCSFCLGEGRVVETTYTSRVDYLIPGKGKQSKTITETVTKGIKGLRTEDIYKVGRN